MRRYFAPSQTSSGWTLALLMGLTGFLLSASRLNHGLVDSFLPHGPGLTTDESINVRQAIFLSDAFLRHGPLMLLPGSSALVYSDTDYLPDHVPLGRFLLGVAHGLASSAIPGAELSVANVPAARLGSSAALAVMVVLIVLWTARRYGTATAVVAAAMLLLMPRVIGHSRIAALETLTSLAWFAAMLPLLNWWTNKRPPTAPQAVVSGLMWGFLMLVKIQAVFLPPVITISAFAAFRLRALVPLSIMAVTGLAVFYGGWPWLWLDPLDHTLKYLMSTTDRPPVHNWYLGQRFEDTASPWHYPFVMTAFTVPLHTGGCFLIRLWKRRLDAAERLLLLSVLVPLLAFAVPGTAVYDGVRLFLFVMPAIAVLGARGLILFLRGGGESSAPADSQRPAKSSLVRPLPLVCCGLLLLDAAVTITQMGPFAGDAWNNAARLLDPADETLECSYWGGAVNGDFWEHVPQGSTVAVAPVLHSVRLQDMMSMIPIVQQRNIQLEPFDYDPDQQRGLVLLLHRLADLRPALRQPPPDNPPVAETRLNGRVLARLVDTSQTTWQQLPQWQLR